MYERLKLKDWKKIYHENINQKKTYVAILILNIIGFKADCITRYKSWSSHHDRRSVHQEYKLLNLHPPNNISSKYTELTLKELQKEADNPCHSELL